MRISDWSSDVCSSDLDAVHPPAHRPQQRRGIPPVLSADSLDHGPQALGRRRRQRCAHIGEGDAAGPVGVAGQRIARHAGQRSEEHTSELQSLMRISYAVLCLKKKKYNKKQKKTITYRHNKTNKL